MSTCIIHIGMHKTGSTSIQHSLHGYGDERFLYASLGAANHSVAMYSLFARHPEQHHVHRKNSRDRSVVQRYVAEMQDALEGSIEQAGARTLVISGEDISVLRRDDLARVREHFGQRFDEVRIVGYVRPPAGFLASSFQERVKGGGIKRFALHEMYRNYEKTFGKFDEIFGRENVSLWKYDPAAFPGGCAVRDFCARLGIALPAARIVRANESLSRQMVGLLFTYARFGQALGARSLKSPESARMAEILASLPSDKLRLSPAAVEPVLEDNRADIAWMEERLGESLDEALGEGRPGDIGEESDLLRVDPQVREGLLRQLGARVPPGLSGADAGEIALLMHALRQQVAQDGGESIPAPPRARSPRAATTGIGDLLEQVRSAKPSALAGLSEDQAASLVSLAFKHIQDSLVGAEDGVVTYGDLGDFRVRRAQNVRRIAFRPRRGP